MAHSEEEFEDLFINSDDLMDTNLKSDLSNENEETDNIIARALEQLQKQIDMVTIEEVVFESTIENNKKKQALRYSEIKDMANKAEGQLDEIKRVIQTFPNCFDESNRAYVDIGLHSRKKHELFAYRNYELTRYFRETIESSKENITSSRAQNQDYVEEFLNSTDTYGSVFEHEKYNLINADLIEDIENLKTEMNSLTVKIEDKKSEISLIKNELQNTQQTIDGNFNEKCNEIKSKLRSKIETAQAFRNFLSGLSYDQFKASLISSIDSHIITHNI